MQMAIKQKPEAKSFFLTNENLPSPRIDRSEMQKNLEKTNQKIKPLIDQ